MDDPAAKPFVIERRGDTLRLQGDLELANGEEIWRDLHEAAAGAKGELAIDLSKVGALDGATVALLVDLRAHLAEHGVKSELVGASEHASLLVDLYQGYQTPLRRPRRRHFGFAEHLGEDMRSVGQAARGAIEFLGDTVAGAIGAFLRPLARERRTVFALVARAGTDAIPLIVLLSFLLGFVMAYDSARQLERYGVQLYIADVVGVAVTRELAPIITAIIVLGRSAAAFSAELGTMKVSEELDALHTMGFMPVRYVVVPRVLALLIVTPLLTVVADICGVLGGALVAATKLHVTPHAFLTELRLVVNVGDVFGGLLKAGFTGLTIAFIGCQQGFAATGGPAGVGARTTATVVKSLVAIVLIDAFFAVLLGAIRK
jgi:phospholipid/cholesterol/gamma-HCH transport system permease protein